ncbi:unnamed protein product [Spirodela intermedia]|uniref:Uncharacterized protein n=1 Tax=Spirodela intermedia TaxID=51605 RepID=A0A7I8JEU7_SPIIN|nr:unnamed protein product [Spirodela intermedia]CAA6668688.1 unnamed protein product [Spirodela intermedia]
MEDDVDMSLDLDAGINVAPARPKSKFQPKLKGKLLPKPEPVAEAAHLPPFPPVKQEDAVGVEKAETLDLGGKEEFVVGMAAPMEVDGVGNDEEGEVVREIDVFFNPSPLDSDTQLYVMQYPLRPCWRPYELNERCQEVRMKPKQSKIEFDMAMDVDSENYDGEVEEHLRLRKQVLSSSKIPYVTGYAVGILVGNQLHLNPVHAVMQFRPLMSHIDPSGLQKRKHISQRTGVATSDDEEVQESAKPSTSRTALEPTTENGDDSEEWVSLKYHAADSPISSRYQRKMLSEAGDHIPFLMNSSDYLNCLCPGTSAGNDKIRGLSRRIMLTIPLDERLKKLFLEGGQVHRFDALMHLAPSESPDAALRIIQQYAVLVQGLWIAKTSLLLDGRQALVRDYILFLFTKKNTIPISKVKEINLSMEDMKPILSSLAFERSICNDWKFKEPTDLSFIKRFPDIVNIQESFWSPNETTASSGMLTLSDEIREALPKALNELFRNHRHEPDPPGLREMAVSKSTLPKADPRPFVLAAHGASAPAPELESIICRVAEKIHDVFVPKSSSNPALNPLSTSMMGIFSLLYFFPLQECCHHSFAGRPRTEKLKKGEIVAAVEMALKKQFSASDFNQVLSELCVSNRGAGWLLKSGDDMPK